MKKVILAFSLMLFATGCNAVTIPVPGDCDFIGPLEQGTVVSDECNN